MRILPSINDGEHGDETIVTWDAAENSVVYHYCTNARFTRTGTMTFNAGKVLAHEKVTGNAGGITEVRGTAELAKDGCFRITTEYLKNGNWEPARDATYRAAAAATVIFK